MNLEPRNDQFSILCNETSQENADNGIKRLSIIVNQVHGELHKNYAFLHVNFIETVNLKVAENWCVVGTHWNLRQFQCVPTIYILLEIRITILKFTLTKY